MKNVTTLVCVSIMIWAEPFCSWTAADIVDIPLETVEEAFNQPLPPHPRLFIGQEQVPALRSKVKTDEVIKTIYDQMLQEADLILAQTPVQRIMTGKRLLHISRECLRRVFILSAAYLFEQDDRYLQRAEQEMLAAEAFDNWNPDHYLDVAEMTAALAIGYDWLYDGLTEDSRQNIREAIITKGIQPSFDGSSRNWWITSDMNWNQVCHGGLALGAMAIAEEDPNLARTVIHRAVNHIQTAMEVYEPDGAYPEGASYWVYGTSYNVLLLAALESVLGQDFSLSQKQGFANSAEYFLHMKGPTGLFYNYFDCRPRVGLVPMVPWFAAQYNQPIVMWDQQGLRQSQLNGNPASLWQNRFSPLYLIWGFPDASMPETLSWVGRGPNPVAVFRSSWTDPNAVFLGIKGGMPGYEHGHMDAGSFVVETEGIRWALDLGPENYNKIETLGMDLWDRTQDSDRWKIFRYNNFSHNTLVVNGRHQNVNGKATLTHFSDATEFPHAIFDLTPVYQDQLKLAMRGAALLPSGQIVIQDELRAENRPTTVRWAMVTAADITLHSEGRALLKQDDKALSFEVIAPDRARLRVYSTETRNDYDQPNPGTRMIGFEVDIEPDEETRLTVCLTPDPQGARTKAYQPIPLASWPQ